MNSKALGFFINKLAVTGPGKPDAELLLADGFNVIYGASDTGKSFALSCIDFTFGASKSPRPIPEVSGYHTVSLHLTARANQQQYVIERGLLGGNVRLLLKDNGGNVTSESVIPFKHNSGDVNTLSGFLLQLSGLWGLQVRKNAKGVRRSLSFRDVAYLCLVDEGRIIAERSPQLSDNNVERTAENEVFRMLVTGNESGEVVVIPAREDPATIDAKLEMVGTLLEAAETEFNNTGLSESQLDTELSAIEQSRTTTLEEYERARLSVTELESQLRAHSQTLHDAQARVIVVEGLVKRFELLDAHYNSNMERLVTIEETGSLLVALPSIACPVCGAPPEAHRLEHGREQYQPAVVQLAARSESEKVNLLRDDLGRVMDDLSAEREQLQTKAAEATRAVNAVQSQISQELTPRVAESAQALADQNSRHDSLLRAKSIQDNIAQLRRYAETLEAAKTGRRSPSPKISSTASSGEMDAFARVVEDILNAWKYPNPGRVIFSETDQDLIIGGNSRASHGKGVRALTCAAFILGILKHCQSKQLPHPSIVALDSPLVAYREPDSPTGEDQELRRAGVKEAFYSSLASGLISGQVIVFENEDPPENLQLPFIKHHFTKWNTGRYGFFPNA